MAAHFEVYEDKAHQWRFRLKAGNGEIVAVGESYPTRQGAQKGCEAVKRAAAEADIVAPKAA
ncbi:YegP family protein [Kitasatospora sp. NPDC059722]|uniref:YegP family protein n=1 Tax=unclassified Kitasatospora TaxID=2633591 RepID=UPI00365DA726